VYNQHHNKTSQHHQQKMIHSRDICNEGGCILKLLCLVPILVNGLSGKGFGLPKTSAINTQPLYEPTCFELMAHLLSQKAEIAGVEVGVTADNRRGLFATKNIIEGKSICKIPSDLALALSDPSIAKPESDPQTAMVRCGVYYLTQYANNDAWRWYTETFPKNLPLTPDAFSDLDDIEILEFPLAVQMVQQRRRDLQAVAVETGLPLSDLQKATTLVSSRSFPIKVAQDNGDIHLDDRGQVITKAGESNKVVRVLLPLIDMANHQSTKFNAQLVLQDAHKDEAWFVLQATRNIRQGQEITISYGAADSVHLLVNYGFTPDDGNPIDTYLLRKHAKDFALSDWSTSLQEDVEVMEMLKDEPAVDREEEILRMILQFRIQLKKSYANI
jgi:SET domain